jgi:transposase, IS5 family
MRGEPGFFDINERLKDLSAKGDDLERLNAIVDFEIFRNDLERAVPRANRAKGGRPPYDHVLMFKVLPAPPPGSPSSSGEPAAAPSMP